MTDTNNEELRAAIIDSDVSRHICDDEGVGCVIEEFKGDWLGAIGTYYRCKQLREHYDQVIQLIASRDQQIALAAVAEELRAIRASVHYDIEKHGDAHNKGFNRAVRWFHQNIDERLAHLTNNKTTSHEQKESI